MSIEGTRRVMETNSADTANQYLRFGWSLINQYVIEATADSPTTVKYVLASVRRLEDTRQVITLTDADAVNAHLQLGWKLIDKYVLSASNPDVRDERLHFVLAWQTDDPPQWPQAGGKSVDLAGRLELEGHLDVEGTLDVDGSPE